MTEPEHGDENRQLSSLQCRGAMVREFTIPSILLRTLQTDGPGRLGHRKIPDRETA